MKKIAFKKIAFTALCAFVINMGTAFSQTWQALPFTYSDYATSAKKVFASPIGNIVIMAYKGQALNTSYDSHISLDGGDTWQPLFADKPMMAALFSPNGNIYLATQRYSASNYLPDTLFRSSDAIKWTNLGTYSGRNQDEGDFCITGNNTLIFPNYDGLNGLYFKKSIDNGVTWTNTGYMQGTAGSGSGNDIIQSAVASYTGDTIIVGTYNKGVRYSHDGGATFNGVSSVGVIYAMAMIPNGDVYIGGLSKSTDGGVTFNSITWEPWVAMTVTEFLYHPPSGKFFTSAVQGIFESTDCIAWTNITGNLTDVHYVKDMAVSQNYLYVAKSADDNLYRYQIQNNSDPNTTTNSEQLKQHSKPLKIYPNPSTGLINIEIEGQAPDLDAMVEVFNLQGQLLMSKNLNSSTFDARDLSKGVYLLKVTTPVKSSIERLYLF